MEKSGNAVAPTLFGELLLDLCDSSVIHFVVNKQQTVHRVFDLRRQLIYCLAHRLIEVVRSLPAHSSVERSTDIGAIQPEIDVLLFVGHRILKKRESTHRRRPEAAYPNHGQENANCPENGLGRCDPRDFLRKVESFDGHIQR